MTVEKLNLTGLVGALQNCAHEGFAMHFVEVHTSHGDSDIIIEDPKLEIIKDEEKKTVRIKFIKA